ncbi:hypothetical protein FHI69_03180 [Janthinobacterium lividum]|uniref:Uncharacterized protein n=1 Tax=Janthinobacterium lividum TaxID=29581 RepID=A0A5C4P075_9BURK|nr:hypothetical protein [Janthinobacterium lividum]TNC78307.1 hypothetical protein FHI69_03180 [Janthinobacterium lividum]
MNIKPQPLLILNVLPQIRNVPQVFSLSDGIIQLSDDCINGIRTTSIKSAPLSDESHRTSEQNLGDLACQLKIIRIKRRASRLSFALLSNPGRIRNKVRPNVCAGGKPSMNNRIPEHEQVTTSQGNSAHYFFRTPAELACLFDGRFEQITDRLAVGGWLLARRILPFQAPNKRLTNGLEHSPSKDKGADLSLNLKSDAEISFQFPSKLGICQSNSHRFNFNRVEAGILA